MSDIKEFHANFYSTTMKTKQDTFILKHIEVRKPQRERNKIESSSRKGVSVQYFVKLAKTDKFQVQVCQKAFLNILHVSKDRVQRIARNFLSTGQLPKEKRGGSRHQEQFHEKRKSVKQFIENLHCAETHYCRGKSMCRQYLPGNLSIAKLLRVYNECQCYFEG